MRKNNQLDDELNAVEEILRRRAPQPPAPQATAATAPANGRSGSASTSSGCLGWLILAGVLLAFMGWRKWQATLQPPAKGIVTAQSTVTHATLFYRKVGAAKWRFVDCNPQAKVALSPGRYQVRIEGEGRQIIVQEREIEVLPDQPVSITPGK